jgi:hypothetical protein
MAVPPLERYFQKITNRFFFKQHYEYAVALEELSVILNTNIEMGPMVLRLLQTLDNILHPSKLEFFHNVTGELFKFAEYKQHRQSTAKLQAADDETQIIVISDTKTVGTFTLGPKRSGDPYTREDFTLLRTFIKSYKITQNHSKKRLMHAPKNLLKWEKPSVNYSMTSHMRYKLPLQL